MVPYQAKMVYMSGVLEMYEKLLGHMLKQLPTPSPKTAELAGHQAATAATATTDGDVRKQLSYILKKVQDLRRHRYHEQNQILQGLHALKHIQVHRRTFTGPLCSLNVTLAWWSVRGKASGKALQEIH